MIWTIEFTSYSDLHYKVYHPYAKLHRLYNPLSFTPCQKFQGTGSNNAITCGELAEQAKSANSPDHASTPCQHPGGPDRAADIREARIKYFWMATRCSFVP